MQIEIAEPGRMTQSGSSLLRLIQNNNMPILDLFVRESIQNSLDAGNHKDSYVHVSLQTGGFDSDAFCDELDVVGQKLKIRFSGENNRFLAIRDYHTVGLTGVMDYSDVGPEGYGNLLKLVYEISKPQDAEGAGGSWGLGKTIYFRVGIGLVVYYSRIRLDNGAFQSRLAVTFVEDETSRSSIIPRYEGQLKRGIAWWGKQVAENHTQPITDEYEIDRILDEFGIDPYSDNETGTTIIIPYIDSEKLLHNNATEYVDANEQKIRPYWMNSVEDYLNIAVQRWYAPRLNNQLYSKIHPDGMYLRVDINGEEITANNMEPAFLMIQQLYNRANGRSTLLDMMDTSNLCQEEIRLRNIFSNKSVAGVVSAAKLSRRDLHMNPPDNKPSPYIYYNCDMKATDFNKSIICFTRKPGMIVSYQNVGDWADGLPESDPDHYIIAIFVLNSNNTLTYADNMSLEEYVRKSEMADHTDWGDYNIGRFNPRIISKTQKQIVNKIIKAYEGKLEKPEQKKNTGLGRMLGEMFLPPENFGRGPSEHKKNPDAPARDILKHKNVRLVIYTDDTEYHTNSMVLHIGIISKRPVKGAKVSLAIDSESGAIKANEWEEKYGLRMPFSIRRIYRMSFNKERLTAQLDTNTTNMHLSSGGLTLRLDSTESSDSLYQITCLMDEPAPFDIRMRVEITSNKDARPVLAVTELEADK